MISTSDGFLVERFPGVGPNRRVARIVDSQPEEGRLRVSRTVQAGGRRYTVAFHFPPGIRQGRAIAWPREAER